MDYKATVSKIWHQCPTMLIDEKKTSQLSGKCVMTNYGLQSNCYTNMANFCCWWGEALSPLKVSQENAKSFFEMWNNADSWKSSSGKIVQVSAKREMSNDGL